MIAGHSSGSFVLRYCLTYSIVRCGLNQSSTVGASAPAPWAGSREVIPLGARIGNIHVAAARARRRKIASPEGPLRGIGGTEAANPKRGWYDAYADTAVVTPRRSTSWSGGLRRSNALPR